MAAHDPEARRQAASTAARARLDRMTPEQRQAMTADARRALRLQDLAIVDAEAAKLGQHPLDEDTRNFRADVRAALRARQASDAATRAMKLRRRVAELREAGKTREPADHEAGAASA